VDDRAHRGGHRNALRRAVPPGAHQPRGPRAGLDGAGAPGNRYPARRGGDPPLVGGALASTQKGAAKEGRTVVWVDESGFYLLPARVRTYAPRGQTPALRVFLTRDHLSVISAVTPAGRLLLMVREHAIRSVDVVHFLKHLLAHLPGKLLVVWDGAPIHRGQPVKDFLAGGAATRLRLEQLPGYAPDLNPLDQGIWRHLKHVELRNVCCADLCHLRSELRAAARRLRHKPHIVRACIRHAGYDL
jgi:transposase